MKRYLEPKDLGAYRIAFELSNYIWGIVTKWNYFAKDTAGKQLVKAIDSISANISEGFGRYFKKDKINFYHYSYGSINESLDWVEKANKRGLLKEKEYKFILEELEKLPKEINSLVKFTKERLAI
jgi:four helix bundle protein